MSLNIMNGSEKGFVTKLKAFRFQYETKTFYYGTIRKAYQKKSPMKNFFIILLLLISSFDTIGYEIKGKIKGYDTSDFDENIYLARYPNLEFNSIAPKLIIDSSKVHKNGTFHISGQNLLSPPNIDGKADSIGWDSQEGVICRLYLVPKGKPIAYITSQDKHGAYFLLKNDTKIQIKTNADNFSKFHLVEEDEANKALSQLRQEIVAPLYDQMALIEKEFTSLEANEKISKDSLNKRRKRFQRAMLSQLKELKPSIKSYVKSCNNYYVGVFAIMKYLNFGDFMANESKFVKNFLLEMQKEHPNALYLKLLDKKLAFASALVNKDKAPGLSGKKYELEDPLGNEVKLGEYKGDYLLIDFWASWCKPCIQGFEEILKPLYQKYQGANFEIISIALEKEKDRWKSALKELDLPWVNLKAADYPDDQISDDYGVSKIPHYVLVGNDGSILKSRLIAPQLRAFLKDSLKLREKKNIDRLNTENDTVVFKIGRESGKKYVEDVKEYLKNKGFEFSFSVEYGEGKINSIEGSISDGNARMTFSSPRLKQLIIQLYVTEEKKELMFVKTEDRGLFGN